jgi:hypothetical protein
MDTHELAWGAGFFDGEGSTCVLMRRAKRKTKADHISYYLRLTVTQTSVLGEPQSLLRLQALFGGRIHKVDMAKYPANYKQRYVYLVGTAAARRAMMLMWPWLGEEKREQYDRAKCRAADREELARETSRCLGPREQT